MSSASYKSVVEMFRDRVSSTPDGEAMLSRQGAAWRSMLWREVGQRVHHVACGLRALGLEDEQRCSILSSRRPEWIIADLGILSASGATTTIYPSNTAEEIAFIISDSSTVLVFAENDEQVAKLRAVRQDLADVKKVIRFDQGAADDWVIDLPQLEALGREWAPATPAPRPTRGGASGTRPIPASCNASATPSSPTAWPR